MGYILSSLVGLHRFQLRDLAFEREQRALEHGAVGPARGTLQLVERARAREFERREALAALALFAEDLWLETAAHSNRMARLLAAGLEGIPRVRLTQPVESNAVFAHLPREHVAEVQRHFFFYVWNEQTSEVRLMCSFDTTEEDVRELARVIREVVG